jgi:hypothetical protein
MNVVILVICIILVKKVIGLAISVIGYIENTLEFGNL